MDTSKNMNIFKTRTDLIDDLPLEHNNLFKEETYEKGDIKVSRVYLDKTSSKEIDKKSGYYTTISFNDATDHNNYDNVVEVFSSELRNIMEKEKITSDDTCLVIGLGNDSSTPDSLGIKTSDKVIITKHIYDLYNNLETGFRITSRFNPGVMGETGIETSDILKKVIELVNPSFVLVIDALASSSIERVCKTIQITNAGISPGSGIGNKRKEISKDNMNRPIIAIGIPMVVDAATIVFDTINYMEKHFSYNLKNQNNPKNKLIPFSKQNYLKEKDLFLNNEQKTYFFGKIGTLSDDEKRILFCDVLTPIGYNLMVTPTEIDFQVDVLSKLLGEGINNVLHHINTTK